MFSTSRIKIAFIVVSVIFIMGVIIYSHQNIRELRVETKKVLSIYTELYAKLASDDRIGDFSFIFEEIINRLTFPIIITADKQTDITAWKNIPSVSDDARLTPEIEELLLSQVRDMDRFSEPVLLTYEGRAVNYIHYGDSRVITRLKWMPYIELFGASILVLLAFIVLEYIRSSEKKFIWVGLAKETAHQLGTPISSLMGWLELAKSRFGDKEPEFEEMNRDIQRLEKVSHRFSQIGSRTKRSDIELEDVIKNVMQYISSRIPSKNSQVELIFKKEKYKPHRLKGNADLLEWALENLIKNAVDALEGHSGTITVTLHSLGGKKVMLDVSDTGKGIPDKFHSTVFKAGYSTKKRGWGLGLTLTQRIIEEYHRGKIYVLHSTPGVGSTFRIELK